MKTETEIAKENLNTLEEFKLLIKNSADFGEFCFQKIEYKFWKNNIIPEHKQTCQRFLEFLENFYRNCKNEEIIFEIHDKKDIEEKIQDLKQAIKLYEKEGI